MKKISDQRKHQINQEFPAARRRFLRGLVRERGPELSDNGLSFAQITRMRRGHTPKKGRYQWVVHHVIPRALTGLVEEANSPQNLCLLRKSTHRLFHEYIDPQVGDLPAAATRLIHLPTPPLGFYPASRAQAFGEFVQSKTKPKTAQPQPQLFPAFSHWTMNLLRTRLLPLLSVPSAHQKSRTEIAHE